MIDGLAGYLAGRGLASPADLVGRVLPRIGDWGELDLTYTVKARIDAEPVHPLQPVPPGLRGRRPPGDPARAHERPRAHSMLVVDDAECVGCRLCEYVCPVDGCITMEEVEAPVPVAHG